MGISVLSLRRCMRKHYTFSKARFSALLQLVSLNFAADCLREFITENNNSGVFVGSCMALYVVLNFLFKLLGTLCTLRQHDACFNYLTSNLIGHSGNAALQNVGKLHDNAFNLEGSDTVARRLNNVVNA